MKNVTIETPYIKLDSLMKLADMVSTGGEAKRAIQAGFVSLNNEICTERGKKVYPGDEVGFLGKKILVAGKC